MNQTSTGTNRVEVKMVFTSDASKATSELSKIAMSAKNVDMAAKEAQKNLERMNGPNGASKINAPAFPTTVRDSQGNTHSVQAWQSAQKRIEAMQGGNRVAEPPKVGMGGGGMLDLVAKGAIAISVVNSLARGLETLGDVSKGTRSKVLGLVEAIPVAGGPAAALSGAALNFGERGIRKDLRTTELMNAKNDAQGQNQFVGDQKLRSARLEQTSMIEQARSSSPSYFISGLGKEDERITAAKMAEDRAMKAANRAIVDSKNFGTVEEIGRKGDGRQGTEVRKANVGVDVRQNDLKVAEENERQKKADLEKKNSSFLGRNEALFDIAKNPLYPLIKAASGGYADKSPIAGLPQQEESQGKRKELGRELINQEETLRIAKEKQINAALKINEYEKARTETMKAQAQLLKDQYAEAKNKEMVAGSTSYQEKQKVLGALKESERVGFGGLSEEKRNALLGSQLTSDYAKKKAQEIGANDSTLAEINRITGGKSSKDIGEELKDISAKVNVKIDLDEDKLAEKIANIMGRLFKKLEVILDKSTSNANAQIEGEFNKQRNIQDAS